LGKAKIIGALILIVGIWLAVKGFKAVK